MSPCVMEGASGKQALEVASHVRVVMMRFAVSLISSMISTCIGVGRTIVLVGV